MNDRFFYERKKLVKELELLGIDDKRILKAFLNVKRDFFASNKKESYENKALPILCNQTISQPYTIAFMIQALKLNENDKVLEIGTGSGYNLALICQIVRRKVYSLETRKTLIGFAEKNLRIAGIENYEIFHRNGFFGLKEKAPFDKIIVTAAPKEIPVELIKQLKIDGIMIVPVGEGSQKMIRLIKKKGRIIKEELGEFAFVPMTK